MSQERMQEKIINIYKKYDNRKMFYFYASLLILKAFRESKLPRDIYLKLCLFAFNLYCYGDNYGYKRV